VKPATLKNLVSPYNPKDTYYYQTDDKGHAWVLYVKDANGNNVYRTDSTSSLTSTTATPSF